MPDMGEFELIERIRTMFPLKNTGHTGIGDDCAVIDGGLLVTADALVDGVHFLSDKADWRDIGYKAAAVNVSDLAAMCGYARSLFLTLGIPHTMKDSELVLFLEGLQEAALEYGFDLSGGDTVNSGVFFASVTAVGLPWTVPVYRAGARKGDYIYVTGTLGDSAIGLSLVRDETAWPGADSRYYLSRHYRPRARTGEAGFLVKNYTVHAAIDISDGLLADLGHVAALSGLGYTLDAVEIPLSTQASGPAMVNNPRALLEAALSGGEDYELLFTSPELIDTERFKEKTGTRLSRIGYMTDNGPIVITDGIEVSADTLKQGFRHF